MLCCRGVGKVGQSIDSGEKSFETRHSDCVESSALTLSRETEGMRKGSKSYLV